MFEGSEWVADLAAVGLQGATLTSLHRRQGAGLYKIAQWQPPSTTKRGPSKLGVQSCYFPEIPTICARIFQYRGCGQRPGGSGLHTSVTHRETFRCAKEMT